MGSEGIKWEYPVPPRDDSVKDVYKTTNGEVAIADPFRPLEDPHAPETEAWVEKQVDLFQNKYFGAHPKSNELRDQIEQKLLENMNYEKIGCPSRRRGRLFFSKNDGLQNQSVIYKTIYAPNNEEIMKNAEVLIDPNELSSDGTTSISFTSYDDEGRHLAYGVNRAASDWTTIHVMEVETKKELVEDKLQYCKFTSVAWLPDGSGFFYARYPEPKTLQKEEKVDSEDTKLGSETEKLEFQKVYFHRLGESQDKDQLVYEDKEHPNWMFGVGTTDDDEYLLITVSESTKEVCQFYYARLFDGKGSERKLKDLGKLDVVKLIDNFDAQYDYLTNYDTLFFFRTNLDAPNSKVISIDIEEARTSGVITRKEVIPEKEHVLNYALVVAENKLVANYTVHVKEILQLYELPSGAFLRDIELPGIGSIGSIHGRREYPELFYFYSSFTTPGIVLRHHVNDNTTSTFYATKIGLDLSGIETRQVFYESKDGTKIPMFITCRKDTKLDGTNPVWLYGYGGFNISMTPYFSVKNMFFVKHFERGIFALANIRGGGEYGEKWHEAGIKEQKQNVFDDFIAAAEYLVAQNYTRPELITIEGGSNGGLLVAAVMLQRPDLFGSVLVHVGVLDMLRYHRFTIGWAWKSDYGCADEPSDFEYLLKYSPVHNVKEGVEYPSCLILTSDHDDRVVPLHSHKFTATLQTLRPNNKRPLLTRIETKAGHGAGVALKKTIKVSADVFAFVATELRLQYLP